MIEVMVIAKKVVVLEAMTKPAMAVMVVKVGMSKAVQWRW